MLDLDAIEAALTAMTPGPWSYGECCGGQWIEHLGEESVATFEDIIESEENLKGIALLRNAAPELTRRIREQETVIERLRALCGEAALKWWAPGLSTRLEAASKGEQ